MLYVRDISIRYLQRSTHKILLLDIYIYSLLLYQSLPTHKFTIYYLVQTNYYSLPPIRYLKCTIHSFLSTLYYHEV